MTAPSSPSSPSALRPVGEQPSLLQLAKVIHHATTDAPVARIVTVSSSAEAAETTLGFWDVPPVPAHPIEPLVGFVAPDGWEAVGIITSGRLRHLDRPDGVAERTVSTVLLDRCGRTASVIDRREEEPLVLEDRPVGLVPDVLSRVLGLPTPPPDLPTGALVELTWLDRIAVGVIGRRSRTRTWRWLADRHPLRGGGPVPSPEELAARVAAYSEERTWAGLRLLAVTGDLPAVRWGPPGGSTAPGCTWFDDGALSRWLLRDLPPAEALLPDLVSLLPGHVGADLLGALGEVDGTWPPRTPS